MDSVRPRLLEDKQAELPLLVVKYGQLKLGGR